MPTPSLPQNLTMDDYERIEGAVMETVRGRWFLMEFARRSRAAELAQIRDSIARLERALGVGAMPAAPVAPAPVVAIAPPPPRPAPVLVPPPQILAPPQKSPRDQALDSLSRFDRLPAEEKMALFG